MSGTTRKGLQGVQGVFSLAFAVAGVRTHRGSTICTTDLSLGVVKMLDSRLVRAPAQRQSPKHGDTFADYYLRGLAAPSLGPFFFSKKPTIIIVPLSRRCPRSTRFCVAVWCVTHL